MCLLSRAGQKEPRLTSSPLGGGDDVVDEDPEAWQLASVVVLLVGNC